MLDILPSECIVAILNHVSPSDIDNCCLLNFRIYEVIKSNIKRLPKYKIETIVKSESNGYFIHHCLPHEATPKIVPEKLLNRCEIVKITFSFLSLSAKPIINKWIQLRMFNNLNVIEYRGPNWEIIIDFFGSLLKNVKIINILDLSCNTRMQPLNNLYFKNIFFDFVQILGCKTSYHELQTFIILWKTACNPKIFDEITLCFGTQQLEEKKWSILYPNFVISNDYNEDVKLVGNFVEYNCLQFNVTFKKSEKFKQEKVESLHLPNKIPPNYVCSNNSIIKLPEKKQLKIKRAINICSKLLRCFQTENLFLGF